MADETQVPEQGPKTIEYTTYQRVVSAKQGLETQVGELKDQVASLSEKVATVDNLTGQVTEWQQKAQQAETRFARFKDIAEALGSTDSDAIEAVEWQYGKLSGDDKPEMATWLSGLKEAPDTAPAVLRPFLTPQAAVKAPEAADKATEPGKPPGSHKASPRPPAASSQPPGAPSQHSPEQIRIIRESALRTGDWSKYREIRKAWAS